MKYLYILSLLMGYIFLQSSCATSNTTTTTSYTPAQQPNAMNEVDNPEGNISLADHLRKVPGVNVSGSGTNASVRIRGIKSFYGSSEPIFVVNGVQVSGGFASLSQTLNVYDIKSITVLKDPSDTALYGVRGANGIIEIKLKN